MAARGSHRTITGLRRRIDRDLTRPMAMLSMAFLVLLAGALPPLELEEHLIHDSLVNLAKLLLLIIWPVFMVEFLFRRLWLERGCSRWGRTCSQALAAAAPPLRLLISPLTAPRCVWLPWVGWQRVGRALYRNLERAFSMPMVLIALLILPALVLEFMYRKELLEWPAMSLAVDVGTRLIWLAFALELLFMLAASRDKVGYCISHWLDVAIVVFPLLPLMRWLPVLRLTQMGRLVQLSRVYRVRALALRAWRALLLIKGLERYSIWTAQKRLDHLNKALEKKLHDVDDLRHHIRELEQHLEQSRADRLQKLQRRQKPPPPLPGCTTDASPPESGATPAE